MMRYYHTYEDKEKFYLVTDLYSKNGGDLQEMSSMREFSEREVAIIIRGILNGLMQLH